MHPRDHDAIRNAFRPNTRLLFGEVIGNPSCELLDIEAVSEIAHEHGVPLLIDSTFTTPYLCRPFDLGADLIFPLGNKILERTWCSHWWGIGRQRQIRLD